MSEELIWRDNCITVEEYLGLRKSVGWRELSVPQADLALGNSLYITVAYEKCEGDAADKPVAMGRIVGDGAVICYVQDLIVSPDYQGKGLGSICLERLKKWVEDQRLYGTTMMLDLMCAKGREEFYVKHGFTARPTEDLGPGMIIYLKDE